MLEQIIGGMVVKAAKDVVGSVLKDGAEDGIKGGAKKAFDALRSHKPAPLVFPDPNYRFSFGGVVELQNMQGEALGRYARVHVGTVPVAKDTPEGKTPRLRTMLISHNAAAQLLQKHQVPQASDARRDLNYVNFIGMLCDASTKVMDSRTNVTVMQAETPKQEASFAGRMDKIESGRYLNAVVAMSLSPNSPNPAVKAARAFSMREEQRLRFLGNNDVVLADKVEDHDNIFNRSLRHMSRLFGRTTPSDLEAAAAKAIQPVKGPNGQTQDMIALRAKDAEGHDQFVRISRDTVEQHLAYFDAVNRREPLNKDERQAYTIMAHAQELFVARQRQQVIAAAKAAPQRNVLKPT